VSVVLTGIRFKPASRSQRQTGLIGFVQCQVDGRWLLDGIRVCIAADSRVVIVFPSRIDASGNKHPIVRPVDDETRELVESAILDTLRRERRIA
jgi:DNA-binding cell septation regulator SpoVG